MALPQQLLLRGSPGSQTLDLNDNHHYIASILTTSFANIAKNLALSIHFWRGIAEKGYCNVCTEVAT